MKSINQNPNIDRPVTYQIRVQGRIDESWSDWFDGMAITFERGSDGGAITALTGAVVDQAALHGLIVKILNLNLNLISLNRIVPASGRK